MKQLSADQKTQSSPFVESAVSIKARHWDCLRNTHGRKWDAELYGNDVDKTEGKIVVFQILWDWVNISTPPPPKKETNGIQGFDGETSFDGYNLYTYLLNTFKRDLNNFI
jgi:hypothetical protein